MKSNVLLIISFFITCGSSWHIFHRGRGKHGYLGEPETDIEALPAEKYFDQRLDHFNSANTKTWKQRYFENDTFYERGGPIFLMIGGEAELSPRWMVAGTWIDYAQRFKALCLMVEHRFYGKSRPTDDLSIDNLSYLSSEQALADLAWFITSFSNNNNFTGPPKWIVFGGSYAGSLATWMRLKYPHLVFAAVSSSSPLLALPDFKNYYKVVQKSLASYDPHCLTAVAEGTKQLAPLLSHPSGQGTVVELFHLCDHLDPEKKLDVATFYEALASNFADIVQYNKDNRQSALKNITVDVACNIMLNETLGPEVNRLAAVNSLLLNTSKTPCLEVKYDKFIKSLQNTSWDSDAAGGGRQWTYQTCSEFGFFQTSELESTKTVFGDKFPIEFFIGWCTDIYGKKFDAKFLDDATRMTNAMYGGLNEKVDNVVYVRNSRDPWDAIWFGKTRIKQPITMMIEGTAHCADMYPFSPEDPVQLVGARVAIRHYLEILLTPSFPREFTIFA